MSLHSKPNTQQDRESRGNPPLARVPAIDCQWHWYPPAVCEMQTRRRSHPLWERRNGGYRFEPEPGEVWFYDRAFVDLEHQLETMHAAGIAAVVMSPVIAGDVSALEVGEARALCTAFNEELSRAQDRYPGQVHGLATLPLQDPEVAVEILDDAIVRLSLHGLLLHSNVAGASIATPQLEPLYERLEALDVPVFLHPTRSYVDKRITDFALEPPLAYMFDTSVAALSLVIAGVLDRYPLLKIVHPHLGGTLPYLADRVDVYRRLGRVELERPVRDYLSSFYTDTVSESSEALWTAARTYGIGRMLFASDYPYFPAADGVDFIAANLAPVDAAAVMAGNAGRLLGIDVGTPEATHVDGGGGRSAQDKLDAAGEHLWR